MQFEYTKREWSRGTIYVPTLPMCLNGFPVGHVLIDTGADMTLLPIELSDVIGVDLDRDNAISATGAGGEDFMAIPSVQPVEYAVERGGFRPITWKGIVFFVREQPTILLGQYQCLSEVKITLDGKNQLITLER